MPLRPAPLALALQDRLKLEDLLRSRRTPERLRVQCQILLLGAEGHANAAIASRLNLTRSTVMKWRRRFREGDFRPLAGSVPGDPAEALKATRVERLRALITEPPPEGAAAWTIRALAQVSGLSPATVQRTLTAQGLHPNPRRSPHALDPRQLSRVVDLLGIYLHAPYHAVVLEVDPRREARDPGSALTAPTPGQTSWLLHLHLRSLEGLRQLDGFTTHYTSNFWRFLLELRPRNPGHHLWCLTDTPMFPDHLRQLERERPDLRLSATDEDQDWLQAMKAWVIPTLHARKAEGGCPSLEASVEALEGFIRGNAPDPFQWTGA